MYCLGAVGRACGRGFHRAPVRALALSAARPGTGSPELDQLILASSLDKVVAPPAALPSPTYTSPLTGDTSPLTGDPSPLLPTDPSAYISPFASVEKIDFTNLAEPSLQSLGLAHQWPSGWMQSALELMHVDLGLPWWQAIVATTVCLRIVAWPILVVAQRNMANLNNHAPTVQKLQVQASLAAARGDDAQVAFSNAALNAYMDEHKVHPVKSMFPMWCNGLFITSMFFALRGMTNAPVESMTTGGTAWFTDLVATDPTFVLPLTAAATVGLMMYLGADGISLDTMPPIMKKIMLLLPIVSIPVMISFPAALGVYWCTNNFISLIQSRIMRLPGVRARLGIPDLIRWKPEDLPMASFMEEMKKVSTENEKKKKDQANAKERNKIRIQEHETKVRGSLLEAFSKEDQERLQRNVRKRLENEGKQ